MESTSSGLGVCEFWHGTGPREFAHVVRLALAG